MFISYYTIICFFVKNFFSNVYISVNTICECSYLSFGWEIGYPLSMYVTNGMEWGHPKCLQMRTQEEEYGGRGWSFSKLWKTEKINKNSLKAISSQI